MNSYDHTKQIESSRTNSAKSLGLLSGSRVLKGASRERFETVCDSSLVEHQPANQSEVAVVIVMAIALWRRLLILGVEKFSVDLEFADRCRPTWHIFGEHQIGRRRVIPGIPSCRQV